MQTHPLCAAAARLEGEREHGACARARRVQRHGAQQQRHRGSCARSVRGWRRGPDVPLEQEGGVRDQDPAGVRRW